MIIYKVTNKINDNIYIGKTVNSINRRKQNHINLSNKGSNTYFHNAIRKYGPENFIWEVIFECLNKEELNQMEKFFIANYKATDILYNMTDGGDGFPIGNPSPRKGKTHSEDSKRKMRESLKGRTSPRKGCIASPETRKKLSDSHKGKPKPWMVGRACPEDKKAMLRILHKGNSYHTGIKHSPEVRKKIGDKLRNKPWSQARRDAQNLKNNKREVI